MNNSNINTERYIENNIINDNNINKNSMIKKDINTNINNNNLNNNINNNSKNNILDNNITYENSNTNNNNVNNNNSLMDSINNVKRNKNIKEDMISKRNNKENIEDESAKKITNLFRKLLNEKKISHQKLYKDILELSPSEYIRGLNPEQLNINLAPETPYIYLGTKFNNKKDGLGLEIFNKNKASYFGIFKNGKRVEARKFIIKNETKEYSYYGQIYGIYAWGYGWLKDKKGKKKYEGTWERSMKNGYGIEKYGDKSEYRGCYLNGKKEGIGYYQWKDGSSYEGEYKEDKLYGYGIYKFSDGLIYEGQWKDNKFHGFGEFTQPGIKKYIGYFEEDKRSGFGIEIMYKKQRAFIGFWKNDKTEECGKFI